MKSSAIIPLVLGGIVGLAAIKLGVDAIQRAQGQPAEIVTVVTAITDIPSSVAISEEMVAVVETPATPLIPEGHLSTVKDAVGRVTSKSIPQGSIIAPLSLAPPGTPPGLTERIHEGYRAVSVKIDEVTGVAGQIKPGDYVDVIVVMRVRRGNRDETISRIVLQRVKVVAVGQNLGAVSGGAAQKLAKSITLLVRDVEAPKLHLAQTQGKITLAMRGMDDQTVAEMRNNYASDWTEDERKESAGVDDRPAPTTSQDPVQVFLGRLAPEQPEQTFQLQPFQVTVVNGPIRAEGTTVMQRIVYENQNSMKVVDVTMGRSGEGRTADADSAESIMRPLRRKGRDEKGDRLSSREYRRPEGTEEPKDREISEE